MNRQQIDIKSMILPHVLAAAPYEPVLPLDVLSAQIGVPAEQLVKLDANENPYGPAPAVLDALANYHDYHIYPDPAQDRLRDGLAAYTGALRDEIMLGSGADELIDLLFRVFAAPGDEIIDCVPTFGMYRFSAEVNNVRHVAVLRRPDFSIDPSAVLAATTARTKIIWLTSPNNPTGNLLPEADARAILAAGVPTVIDEAYFEFSGESLLHLRREFENLIILRTFSKWAGMAGLRIGYGLCSPEIVAQIMKIKPPYNVNIAGAVAARAALADVDHRNSTIAKIVGEREALFRGLAAIDYLAPVPSRANFIYCSVTRGSASSVQNQLRRLGILVRHYSTPLLKNSLRISVGRPIDHTRLFAALAEVDPEAD